MGLSRIQRWGFVSISAGRRVAVWGRWGAQRVVAGPATIFVWGAAIQELRLFIADPTQYIRVIFRGIHHHSYI